MRIMNEIANGGKKEIVTTEQWQQVRALFEEALNLEPSARAEFIASTWNGDEKIRAQVLQMLDDYVEADGFLEKPLAINLSSLGGSDESLQAIGRMVGPYRIMHEIGRGGMSVVYLAERADDFYSKQVAVKLLSAGLMTSQIERRFRQERHILARLDHPNIAHLFDGGVTEDRGQYVVMEYVEGEPITKYCNSHRLSIAERLKIF